jgi:hypothetical protein
MSMAEAEDRQAFHQATLLRLRGAGAARIYDWMRRPVPELFAGGGRLYCCGAEIPEYLATTDSLNANRTINADAHARREMEKMATSMAVEREQRG